MINALMAVQQHVSPPFLGASSTQGNSVIPVFKAALTPPPPPLPTVLKSLNQQLSLNVQQKMPLVSPPSPALKPSQMSNKLHATTLQTLSHHPVKSPYIGINAQEMLLLLALKSRYVGPQGEPRTTLVPSQTALLSFMPTDIRFRHSILKRSPAKVNGHLFLHFQFNWEDLDEESQDTLSKE